MPDLNEPILSLIGDVLDPAVPDMQTMDTVQLFFERQVGENSELQSRDVALALLGSAGTRIQLNKLRGARHTLAHMKTRFRGQYRDLEQIADFFEACILFREGELAKAAELTERLEVHSEKLRTRKRLECYQNYLRGEILVASGRPDGALRYLDRALDRLKGEASQRVDLGLTAVIYNCYGRCLSKLGRYQEALISFGRANTIASHISFILLSLRSIRGRGQVLARVAPLEEAVAQLRESLRISKEACAIYDIVVAAIALGRAYYLSRQYSNALLCFEEARIQCGEGRYPLEEAEVNSRIGDILVTEGRYAQAAEYYEADLRISVNSGNDNSRAHALKNVGRIQRLLGYYERSEQTLTKSRALFLALNDYHELSTVILQLALCQIAQGKVDEARSSVEAFKVALDQAGRPAEKGLFQMLEGMVMRREGRIREAAAKLESSLSIFMANPAFYAVLCSLELAQLYEEWGVTENSVRCYGEAIRLARELRIYDMEKRALALLSRVDRAEWARLLHDHSADQVEETAISRVYAAVVMFEFRGGSVFSGLPGEQISGLLDQYFDNVNMAVTDCGGVISRIMGTRVMAVFGLGGALEPGSALRCAWQVLDAVERFVPLDMLTGGVGAVAAIALGEALAGALGPIDRRDHGIFGAPVDMAHTLLSCGALREVLLGPTALQAMSSLVVQPVCREIALPGYGKRMIVHVVSSPGSGVRPAANSPSIGVVSAAEASGNLAVDANRV